MSDTSSPVSMDSGMPKLGVSGRLAAAFQNNALTPLLAYLPVEAVIRDHQEDYYRALAVADSQADATPFVEFMLGALRDAVREAVSTDQVGDQVTDQVPTKRGKRSDNQ